MQSADDSDSAEVAPVPVPVLDTDALPSRYRAYGILYNAGIPLCIWCEDALEHLGVPTATFCLYLVVPDARMQQAADHLVRAGYQKRELPFALNEITQFSNIYGPPQETPDRPPNVESEDDFVLDPKDSIDSRDPPVILLPDQEWFCELSGTVAEMQDCYPTLAQLLTALIYKWMAVEEQDERLLLHIAIHIEYIYEYLDAVRQPGFEESLPQRIWGFHFDRLKGLDAGDWGTVPYQKSYMAKIDGRDDEPSTSSEAN